MQQPKLSQSCQELNLPVQLQGNHVKKFLFFHAILFGSHDQAQLSFCNRWLQLPLQAEGLKGHTDSSPPDVWCEQCVQGTPCGSTQSVPRTWWVKPSKLHYFHSEHLLFLSLTCESHPHLMNDAYVPLSTGQGHNPNKARHKLNASPTKTQIKKRTKVAKH